MPHFEYGLIFLEQKNQSIIQSIIRSSKRILLELYLHNEIFGCPDFHQYYAPSLAWLQNDDPLIIGAI